MAKLYTDRGKTWETANSWWILLTFLPIGMTSFIAFFYVGSKVKNKRWRIYGIIYLAVLILVLAIPTTDFMAVLALALWVVSIVHAFKIRPAYLVQLDVLKANENHLDKERISKLRQEAEEKFRGTANGEIQPPSKSRSLDQQPEFNSSGIDQEQQAPFTPPSVKPPVTEKKPMEKVDINKESESKLAAIPEIGIILAKKVVIKRQEIGGFQSFENFSQIMGLNEQTMEKLRPRVYFSEVQNQPIKTGRMIDY